MGYYIVITYIGTRTSELLCSNFLQGGSLSYETYIFLCPSQIFGLGNDGDLSSEEKRIII